MTMNEQPAPSRWPQTCCYVGGFCVTDHKNDPEPTPEVLPPAKRYPSMPVSEANGG